MISVLVEAVRSTKSAVERICSFQRMMSLYFTRGMESRAFNFLSIESGVLPVFGSGIACDFLQSVDSQEISIRLGSEISGESA